MSTIPIKIIIIKNKIDSKKQKHEFCFQKSIPFFVLTKLQEKRFKKGPEN